MKQKKRRKERALPFYGYAPVHTGILGTLVCETKQDAKSKMCPNCDRIARVRITEV